MSLVQDLQGVLLGRPRVTQKTGNHCTVCGKNIPRGRRYTCSYKCKGVVDRKAKATYVAAQRRFVNLQKLEKGRQRAPKAFDFLFEVG